MKVRLVDICKPKQWKTIPRNDLLDEGYPVYGANGIIGYYSEFNHEESVVTITCRGATCGSINITVPQSYVTGNAMCLDEVRSDIETEYLYYCLKHYDFNKIISGSAQPQITRQSMEKITISIFDHKKQIEILDKLKKIERIIAHRKQELSELDTLIKARFVEMFGDPVSNLQGIKTKAMTDVCEIIDGDRGKNYPKATDFSNEGYCLFLNAKNVTAKGFNFDTCMFVSKEKDAELRKGKLIRGDVVLTTRGTLGNLAFYTDDVPFNNIRINSGMVILRMKQGVVNEIYFIEHFKMLLADIKEKIANGSAQPQLPISVMNKIKILIPDIRRQNEFADFVQQIDKLRFGSRK